MILFLLVAKEWRKQVVFGIQVIDKAFNEAHKAGKDALSRVIVSRADVDMEEIKKAYQEQYNAKLEDMIVKSTHGNYREALLSLVKNWDHLYMLSSIICRVPTSACSLYN